MDRVTSHKLTLPLLVVLAGVAGARRGLARVPRSHGTGTFLRARRSFRMERVAERRLEDARARLGLVVAGRRRRSRVAHDGGEGPRRIAPRPRVRRRRPDGSSSTRRSFAPDHADPLNAKNTLASPTPIVDGDRVYVHFGADGTAALTTGRRDRLEDPSVLRLAARQRRIAGAVPRSADRQLRRERQRVRGGHRQGNRQDPLEDVAPATLGPGLHDTARDSRRRSRSTGQRRRVSRRRLRSRIGQGNLARQLRRRILERPAAGVRPRARLHRDRVSAAAAALRFAPTAPAT